MSKTKVCNSCKLTLSVEDFYFKDKTKTYRHTSCKKCKREFEKSRRDNFKLVKTRSGGSREALTKTCKICEVEKSRENFYEYKDPRRIGVLSAECKTCRTEIKETERKKFSEEKKASERIRFQNYRKSNKHIVNEYTQRRRLRQKQAIPLFSNKSKIREIYRQATILGLSVDHIIPLNSKFVSGLHTENNLQVLPLKENITKSNKQWPHMPEIDDELKQLAKRFYEHV